MHQNSYFKMLFYCPTNVRPRDSWLERSTTFRVAYWVFGDFFLNLWSFQVLGTLTEIWQCLKVALFTLRLKLLFASICRVSWWLVNLWIRITLFTSLLWFQQQAIAHLRHGIYYWSLVSQCLDFYDYLLCAFWWYLSLSLGSLLNMTGVKFLIIVLAIVFK